MKLLNQILRGVVIGVANLLNVKGEVKALISGEDTNIIDADD